jgi:hypothetical protein
VVGGLLLGSSTSTSVSSTNGSMKADQINQSNKSALTSNNNNNNNQHLTTPQQMQKQQIQTPSTLKSSNNIPLNQTPAIGLHKQLRYEDSPSNMFVNQTCELGSFK